MPKPFDPVIENVRIPLSSIRKMPTGDIGSAIWAPDMFQDDKLVQAVIVVFRGQFRSRGQIRKAIFAIETGDYLGEY